MLSEAERAELVELDIALKRERARENLYDFIAYTFAEFRPSWHHRAICELFDQFIAGDIDRLIITAPPRHGKSQIISRHLPAFILGRDPNARIIAASHGADLAAAMNRDVQRIIMSEQYAELFPETSLNQNSTNRSDSKAQGTWLRNSDAFEVVGKRGRYRCAGVGGALIGSGADYALVDDVLRNWQDASSHLIRERQWDWYRSVLRTRAQKGARIAVTLTRWHEADLVGRLLELQASDPRADSWVVVNLPAINEDGPNDIDPRQPGEALWPDEFPLGELARIQTSIGTRIFTALYQGRPTPASGDVFHRDWWQFYTRAPEQFERLGVGVDATFKDGEKSDYFVAQVWGRRGADKYLLHQVRARMAYPQQKRTLQQLHAAYPTATIWVEDAANGAALVADLRHDIPRLIPVTPHGSKVARAEAIAPQAEAGNLHLPDPSIAPWVGEWLEEVTGFPSAAHDDVTDAMSLTISQLSHGWNMQMAAIDLTKRSRWLDASR